MKKIFLSSLLLFAGTVIASDKIGMINTSVLFKEHPIFKQTEQNLKNKIASNQQELKSDQQNIEKKQAELNKKRSTKKINAANAKKEQKAIDDSKLLLEEKRKMFNEEKTKIENSSRQKILQDIQDKSSAWAKENGYKMVIDSGSVVYVEKDQDLTKTILNYIKSKH